MTDDDLIRMAREAGFEINKGQYHGMDADSYLYVWCDGGYQDEKLERFAALVAANEREECAKVCETQLSKLEHTDKPYNNGVRACAATIRARGEK